MGKMILDKSGDLRKEVFYRFDVPLDDSTDGNKVESGSIVAPRTPTNEVLFRRGEEPWIRLHAYGEPDSLVEVKGCAANPDHVTSQYYTKIFGEAFGGKRISSLIPAADSPGPFGLSDATKSRIERLNIRGARIDSIDLKHHVSDTKLEGFWALQFVGRIVPRVLKFVDVANACPHCGKARIMCESCGGDWNATCNACRQSMVIVDYLHEGTGDKRIPFEHRSWRILEGKSWDGSDVISCRGFAFASKRFIDWLLRIHAAPFYAEPVWFCVDRMNEQQKKWFEELQKPFEA
jgi:hypothetical protein